ncbi:hypothetical protein HDU92_004440 [Lobulomyces angularis]|nr:hypothetical protein HDU92_004440 [Lobulomyces angularis]
METSNIEKEEKSSEFTSKKEFQSVIGSIWFSTTFFTLWSTLVCVFFIVPSVNFLQKLNVPDSSLLLSVLSLVLGLLLVFRTNTAYDRFWEGRKLFSQLHTLIRNLSRMIWINVNSELSDEEFEKMCVLNLLYSFSTSIKHNLRSEFELNWPDIAPYISHLPEFTYSNQKKKKVHKNLPLEISFHIAAFIKQIRQTERIDTVLQSSMISMLNSMVEVFTSLERIKNSPIPASYSTHLKHALILYFFSLPFQAVGILRWLTIPLTFIAAFILFEKSLCLGIEAIGHQVENPFGYVENSDLNIDSFCDEIKAELIILSQRGSGIQNPQNWEVPKEIVSKNFDSEVWIGISEVVETVRTSTSQISMSKIGSEEALEDKLLEVEAKTLEPEAKTI